MMNEEDEAFNEIERQAKQRKESVRAAMLREEDDDIQDYKKPWVGLTDEDFYGQSDLQRLAMKYAEAKLKEKNT
jgi:hypothetical protein